MKQYQIEQAELVADVLSKPACLSSSDRTEPVSASVFVRRRLRAAAQRQREKSVAKSVAEQITALSPSAITATSLWLEARDYAHLQYIFYEYQRLFVS